MTFDEIEESLYIKFKNSYLPMLPNLLSIFTFSNQEYFDKFMNKDVIPLDMIKYIIMKFDLNNDTSHANIVKLSLQYVKQTIHFEKIVYIQQSIFSDGSIIC